MQITITEALNKIKTNKKEMEDHKAWVQRYASRYEYDSVEYKDSEGRDITAQKVNERIQAYNQLSHDNVNLLLRIQKTNLATNVTIKIGDNTITKPISWWVWRRREYAKADLDMWKSLNDGNRKDTPVQVKQQDGSIKAEINRVVRNYDPVLRDKKVLEYTQESTKSGLIDTHLSIANATTVLLD